MNPADSEKWVANHEQLWLLWSNCCGANFSSQMLIVCHFRRIKCNKEYQVINCWFCSLADSVLKFSTETFIFIKHLKNWNFLHFSIDIPVHCCPEKANLIQGFCSWYLIERLSGWCSHSVHPRVIWVLKFWF